ncbi:MAG: carbamoyltransferase HypF [bacterium]|nr:carbamoyltransferase HypF [bacterium]
MKNEGAKISIRGIVQGVGFRPFIYRLAKSFNLYGWVKNTSSGVIVEAEGQKKDILNLVERIKTEAPPLSKIENITVEFHPSNGYTYFEIKKSLTEVEKFLPLSPDIKICPECLSELTSSSNRRYRYPFINCTNCGPRFTIIKDIPYDRNKTTMHNFKMCPLCQKEYDDPINRRYHAQPNACFECGPSVKLFESNAQKEVSSKDPIKKTISLLKKGYIIAIKGLGGFHLACIATDVKAVAELRRRKKREKSKPFAIMSNNIEKIRKYCSVNQEEESMLLSHSSPIVLLEKLSNCPISKEVAPGNKYLGVMLSYTPLHHLLLADPHILALIMTSGNFSDEPLTKDNKEATKELSDIADYFLIHNRDIHISCDDSVTRIFEKKELMIRRARGHAPCPIILNYKLPQIFAVGAELKSTFCLTKENYAFLSQHIGNLKNLETLEYFKKLLLHFKKIFKVTPNIVAADLHPNYLSTNFAKECSRDNNLPIVYIQHHHAHIGAVLAENNIDEEVFGVAFDGIGYGEDGNIWGGEFMVASLSSFKRVAHLKYFGMPGGDKATLEPWRMSLSYLYALYGDTIPREFIERFGEKETSFVLEMIKKRINCPLTSSMGRLFDAVSCLIGIREKIDYEAQAAIELEMIADPLEKNAYRFNIIEKEGLLIIEPLTMIEELINDIEKKVSTSLISSKFHNAVADLILNIANKIRGSFKINKVALSGGVFQNIYLLKRVISRLKDCGFIPIIHSKIPPNDGGVSLGQAIIASKKTME